MKHGLYKGLINEGDTEPKIARLTKNSGWKWDEQSSKLSPGIGYSRPWKILEKLD